MATGLIRCPTCGGLLAHREDLAFQWKSCFSCGRQFDERSLSKLERAPERLRQNHSREGITRNSRRRDFR